MPDDADSHSRLRGQRQVNDARRCHVLPIAAQQQARRYGRVDEEINFELGVPCLGQVDLKSTVPDDYSARGTRVARSPPGRAHPEPELVYPHARRVVGRRRRRRAAAARCGGLKALLENVVRLGHPPPALGRHNGLKFGHDYLGRLLELRTAVRVGEQQDVLPRPPTRPPSPARPRRAASETRTRTGRPARAATAPWP